MFDIKDYDATVALLSREYQKSNGNDHDIYDILAQYQEVKMKEWLEIYKSSGEKTKEKKLIEELVRYVIENSTSGNAIVWTDYKTAQKVSEIIWKEIGDFLLDYEIYQDGDEWAIDVMFGGNYVPFWDGWLD